MQNRVRRLLPSVVVAAVALACSEPSEVPEEPPALPEEPAELPECADYRAAEVQAVVALKASESVLAELESRAGLDPTKLPDLRSELTVVRKGRESGRLDGRRLYWEEVQELMVREAMILTQIKILEERRVEQQQQMARAVNDVKTKTVAHAQAVAIRVSQGCADPKPVFESKEEPTGEEAR